MEEKPLDIMAALEFCISDDKAVKIIARHILGDISGYWHIKVRYRVIHGNKRWLELARENNHSPHAKAFTLHERGRLFVYLREGFSVQTLAHELAHVMQVLCGYEISEEEQELTPFLMDICAGINARMCVDGYIFPADCL